MVKSKSFFHRVIGAHAILILLLSTTSAYAFGRLPFTGKSPMLKSLLVLQMFPNTLFLVALYLLFDKLGNFVGFLSLNTHSALVIGYLGGLALNIFMIIGYFDTIDPATDGRAGPRSKDAAPTKYNPGGYLLFDSASGATNLWLSHQSPLQ